MRVGDGNRGNTTQSLNPGDRIWVDEANAVPENVAGAGLNQESALTDAELGFGANSPNTWALRIERVAVAGS
jgi:hypothetical protein